MSLAVFTDSTTAQASPALTCRPTSGSSTNTTSVDSFCEWSLMPSVATLPDTRTHSCDFAYFKSEGTLAISQLSQGAGGRSIRFSIDRLGDEDRRGALTTDFNLNGSVHLGKLRRHIPHPDANAKGRALRTASHLADLRRSRTRAPDRVVRARRCRAVRHFERHELFARAISLLLGQHGSADELALIQRNEEAHARLDGSGVLVQFMAVKWVTNFGAQCVACRSEEHT